MISQRDLRPVVLVHGGAGSYDDSERAEAESGCRAAASAGFVCLQHGGSALDAVISSVRYLEAHSLFNAGCGAALTREGTVEMDASVMEGASLRFGAVAAMPNILHTIDVARLVLESGEHALLSGEGAWAFAREHGITPSNPEALITPRSLEKLEKERERRRSGRVEHDPGTVGAVAVDAKGNVAAATSTGGTTFKRVGRIGDTPLCGSGTYADNRAGAASATGHGEAIMRVTMTRHCVWELERARALEAAQTSIQYLATRVDGEAGIICVSANGDIGVAHNTPEMPWAVHCSAGVAGAMGAREPLLPW